jgi:hypothetical protein
MIAILKRYYNAAIGVLILIFSGLMFVTFASISYNGFMGDYDALALDAELNHAKNINNIQKLNYTEKPEKVAAKAIYLTSYTAGGNLDAFIKRINETDLNAVVIDIKDYTGWIAYDTDVAIINELGTENVKIDDIEAVLEKLHDNDIYTVARMQVFQDPALSLKKPEWTIQNSTTGTTWKDYKGLAWLDPNSREVWDYNVLLAKDAVDKGFDEINLDYIRFPSDGPIGSAVYTHDVGREKTETINAFFTYFAEQMKDEPAYRSADLFGMTMWHESDFNIGQTLVGAAPHFDYVAPMVYPSHYPDGFLGLENPADHPYTVVETNLARGKTFLEKIASSTESIAEIRPWIQDFSLGAVYTADMVKEQLRAAEEHDTSGYFVWNASNRYSYDAFIDN